MVWPEGTNPPKGWLNARLAGATVTVPNPTVSVTGMVWDGTLDDVLVMLMLPL
jgi:hypothetical protein